MIVSEVGRMTSSSSRALSGSGINVTLPSTSTALRREWVTMAHSLANPSTCCASLARNDLGMKSGK
jgi:hypothetical protein